MCVCRGFICIVQWSKSNTISSQRAPHDRPLLTPSVELKLFSPRSSAEPALVAWRRRVRSSRERKPNVAYPRSTAYLPTWDA